MCGIAGMVSLTGAPEMRTVLTMLGLIRHRGPDGSGVYIDDRCALGHVRLSIIDVEGGTQPMCNEDGTLWITFNGEVFNYIELRRELEGAGHRFRTRSDTETIVHAYEEWGEGCWSRFNGQFAAALWDSRAGRLVLARDRVGIAPLHYAVLEGPGGRRVAFASEAKALFAPGLVRPELDPAEVWTAFALWSTPAPRTVWKGVSSVEPGTVLTFDASLRASSARYWSIPFRGGEDSGRLEGELGPALSEAVSLRLRADVPVGAYLSGGLDSAVIATLARRQHAGPLHTFSLRFADPSFDETPQQRLMASWLGTEHHEVMCDGGMIAGTLDEVVWHCEAPLLRLGPLPMFVLSRLVRRVGIKVVLTGEGADELLAGYHIFRENAARRFWARNPASAWRPALLRGLHPYAAGGSGQQSAMWTAFFRAGLTDTGDAFYSHAIRWANSAWTTRLLSQPGANSLDRVKSSLAGVLPADWGSLDPLQRAQAVELATFMSPYLLSSQGDRVALGNGVEPRFAFLDSRVIDLCAGLPRRSKLAGMRDKVALRALARGLVPEEVSRRAKWPFRAPVRSVLSGSEVAQDLLAPSITSRLGLADTKAVSALAAKARSSSSLSEREEMGLAGVVSLHMLALHVTERRVDHVRSAEQMEPGVVHDRRTRAAA